MSNLQPTQYVVRVQFFLWAFFYDLGGMDET